MPVSPSKKRSPSPAPTITLDSEPKRELPRSSSEDSLRVIHHAVLFPSSPNARVTYIRRSFETDADIIKRQLAAIALQPLTYAEELKARRKQLEIKAEKRKQEKAATAKKNQVPEISVIPASGKPIPSPKPSPTKSRLKGRSPLRTEKTTSSKLVTSKSFSETNPKSITSKSISDTSHNSRQQNQVNVRVAVGKRKESNTQNENANAAL